LIPFSYNAGRNAEGESMEVESLWQAKAVALHACFVLLDHALAVGLGIGGVGEEHAFVTGSLFILADTAWLCERSDGVVQKLL
jgi:hypothetical protein